MTLRFLLIWTVLMFSKRSAVPLKYFPLTLQPLGGIMVRQDFPVEQRVNLGQNIGVCFSCN